MSRFSLLLFFFFFNDTATTEIYTLSLHDALPICPTRLSALLCVQGERADADLSAHSRSVDRSEEHTSELQSPDHLVCRLLLEKKKKYLYPVKHYPTVNIPSQHYSDPRLLA